MSACSYSRLSAVRRVNVEAEGGFEAVVHSEDFLKLNQAKVTFCDMWMKN